MTKPVYTVLQDSQGKDREIDVEALGPVIWTLVDEFISGPAKLKIEVVPPETAWDCGRNQPCKAGGTTRNDPVALLPTAPIGALIGKLGGSNADCPAPPVPGVGALPIAGGPKIFAVGSFAVIDVKPEDSGPLFLTMNDTLAGFPGHSGKTKVRVSIGS